TASESDRVSASILSRTRARRFRAYRFRRLAEESDRALSPGACHRNFPRRTSSGIWEAPDERRRARKVRRSARLFLKRTEVAGPEFEPLTFGFLTRRLMSRFRGIRYLLICRHFVAMCDLTNPRS